MHIEQAHITIMAFPGALASRQISMDTTLVNIRIESPHQSLRAIDMVVRIRDPVAVTRVNNSCRSRYGS